MSFALSLALALQVTAGANTSGQGVNVQVGVKVPKTRQVVVTDEMRRTAFRDTAARNLLLRARAARETQDSSLLSYDVKSYQRISMGMSLRENARDRLAFRTENASHVRWQRGVGARVEILGARTAVPLIQGLQGSDGDVDDPEIDDLFAIPYYPGMDELWLFNMIGDSDEEEGKILVHPIAEGSEAFFIFAIGDSVAMSLPDGTRINLRELRVIPREAKWNLVVGSLWFEVERANVVRAVLRFSAPMDPFQAAREAGEDPEEDMPWFAKALVTPMRAELTALTIEYGLLEQRFWLPRLQGAEFSIRASLMRLPLKIEQRYRYASVNSTDALEPIPAPTRVTATAYRDSLVATGVDSTARRDAMRKFYRDRDSTDKAVRKEQCATTGSFTEVQSRHNDTDLIVSVRVPCDTTVLRHSAELPPSIYDAGEEIFGAADRAELMKALDFGLQPAWAPQPPTFEYGLSHTRFNRIEGFGTGGAVGLTLGKGYATEAALHGSLADLQLNGELSLSRSNGRSKIRGTLFRRLAVSSDFGDPFTFGASLSALLHAQDESFYHRAWGAELTGERPMRGGLTWRLFAEEQWSASVENEWSLLGGAHDDRFLPNVVGDRLNLYGAGARWRGSRGLDPAGWRLAADVRLEGATGDADYGRGLLEASVSRGLGKAAASFTAAAGTSAGDLPAQRQFFLGGLYTVRGQTAGTAVGESFWLGRLEVGTNVAAIRPVVFGDLGWAGPRNDWGVNQRPMAGVGVGASFLDGMIRFDVARGIHPKWQTRLDLYLEARF